MEHKNDLGRLICHASVLIRRDLDRAVAQATGDPTLSGRNVWVLRYLADHRQEPVYQKDLEVTFRIRRSTVSCTVELMEQKGLLERQAVNGDGRMKQLRITESGERVLKATGSAMEAYEESLMQGISPEDYQKAASLLEALCSHLEESAPTNNGKERNEN